MYWYYKVPLIAVLVLALIGLGVMVWRALPDRVANTVTETVTEPFGDPDAPDAPDGGGEPEPPDGVHPPPPPPPPQPPVAAEQERRLAAAEQQLRSDNPVAARELAWKVLDDPVVQLFDPVWVTATDIVSRCNTIFATTDAPCPEKQAYTIEEGDSLSRISAACGTTVGALQRMNRLDPTNPLIYPGQVLHYLPGRWSIHVSKSRFALLLYNGDRLFKRYSVGIGRQNRTPVGEFDITSKVVHPDWTPPGKRIPYGDPENVLGTHWLGLTPRDGTDPRLQGYGIHGTWQPETVGTASSLGCVRMRNEEVGELFDLIPNPAGADAAVRVSIED